MDSGEVIETVTANDGTAWRVRLVPDENAENPRTAYDDPAKLPVHVVMLESSNYYHPDQDYGRRGPVGGPLQYAWEHFGARAMRNRDQVALFERYVSIVHHGWTLYESPRESPSCVWYVLPDVFTGEDAFTGDPAEVLEAYRAEYRAYAEGDVYGAIVERQVTWRREGVDLPGQHAGDTMTTWEHEESCWGYLGYTYAEEEAKRMLAESLPD